MSWGSCLTCGFFLRVEGVCLPDFPDVEGPSFDWFFAGDVVEGDHGEKVGR
jgi:hypothetical protein